MSLLIYNGKIIDPAQNLNNTGWVLIKNGKIDSIGKDAPPKDLNTDEKIDAKGANISPGFIDIHVHLREPGQEGKETIETGCQAAVAGGFTSVACMPNTSPTIDHSSIVKFIKLEAGRVNLANVFPIGAVTLDRKGKEMTNIGALIDAGVVAISDDGSPVYDAMVMRTVLDYSRMFNIPIINHCEDLQLINNGAMNEGFFSTKLGLRGIPSACEDVMIARDIILAEYTGGRVHIAHISTAGSVRMIREAKARGVKISCEVTPHHLTLTDESLCEFDTNFKMNPPLRSEKDRLALVEGLIDGTIDAIATDHAPHGSTGKDVEFDYAANGVIGLETALPVIYTKLVKENIISIDRMIELLTSGPAKVIGLENKGSLTPGADADIVLWDVENQYAIDVNNFYSKARNCPFDKWEVFGKPVLTIVNGETKYEAE